MADRQAVVVAVINSSADVVQLLRAALEEDGYRTVAVSAPEVKQGQEDLVAFFEEHDPRVIVYDVSPPYEENWRFLRLVQNLVAAQGREFVITSTNKRALEELVGDTGAIELIGKPYDLEEILTAVARALADKRSASGRA